jgi:hypothetical protein
MDFCLRRLTLTCPACLTLGAADRTQDVEAELAREFPDGFMVVYEGVGGQIGTYALINDIIPAMQHRCEAIMIFYPLCDRNCHFAREN